MIRIIFLLLLLAGLCGGAYLMIRLHAWLIIQWKREIEEYEEFGIEKYLVDDNEGAIHDFAMLVGYTLVPVMIDGAILGLIYYFIKGILT